MAEERTGQGIKQNQPDAQTQSAGSTAGQPSSQATPGGIKIIHEGKEVVIPESDIQKLVQQGYDYTKKTQELGAEREGIKSWQNFIDFVQSDPTFYYKLDRLLKSHISGVEVSGEESLSGRGTQKSFSPYTPASEYSSGLGGYGEEEETEEVPGWAQQLQRQIQSLSGTVGILLQQQELRKKGATDQEIEEVLKEAAKRGNPDLELVWAARQYQLHKNLIEEAQKKAQEAASRIEPPGPAPPKVAIKPPEGVGQLRPGQLVESYLQQVKETAPEAETEK